MHMYMYTTTNSKFVAVFSELRNTTVEERCNAADLITHGATKPLAYLVDS
jgi:hypothetical protein